MKLIMFLSENRTGSLLSGLNANRPSTVIRVTGTTEKTGRASV